MFFIRPFLVAALWFAVPAALAQAQTQAQAQSESPIIVPISNTGASPATPSIKYCSIFEHYTSFKDQEVDEWRKTNDAVHQAGGWRAYAKEARQPEPARAKSTTEPCPSGLSGNLSSGLALEIKP
jgi:hypothetical protein